MDNNKRTELVYVLPGKLVERPASDFMFRIKEESTGWAFFEMDYEAADYECDSGQYPI
jgi:hypothetical protein